MNPPSRRICRHSKNTRGAAPPSDSSHSADSARSAPFARRKTLRHRNRKAIAPFARRKALRHRNRKAIAPFARQKTCCALKTADRRPFHSEGKPSPWATGGRSAASGVRRSIMIYFAINVDNATKDKCRQRYQTTEQRHQKPIKTRLWVLTIQT